MPAQSDPLGHLHEKLRRLNTKVDQLESSISKKVTDDIQSSMPSIVVDTLKENLPDLLLEALKNTLPQMIKDSIKQSVSESIKEKLPLFDPQSRRFVTLQQELSKVIKTKLGVSVKNKDLRLMFKHMVFLLEAAKVFKKANAEGEKWENNNPETPTEEKDAQNPDQTQGERHSGDATMDNAQGEQPPAQELSNVEQAPLSMKKMLWFFML
ncbi:hypothetical protein Tco_0345288 [Tanacetum coccineum]